MAESVSALESSRMSPNSDKCVIDMDVLARYIPKEEPNLLPTKSALYQESLDSAGEREAIIRMLLQLKQDVDYLKEVVAAAGLGRPSVPAIAPPDDIPVRHVPEIMDDDDDPEEQDFMEREPEDMSIKAASLELIEKVLRKHGGNRKAAAAELGISERTLYRKIKQMTEK